MILPNSEIVDIGATADVRRLFSYPPNCQEICFLPQSLEDTVRLYLTSSLQRDMFSNSTISVRTQDDRVLVQITGDAASKYGAPLKAFLGIGQNAFAASVKINTDKKWHYNWRFFLPLGLAMTQHKTVQLLHFPPDYVLERDQDYLSAHTTKRWAELLQENGVAAADTPRYQTIVDIAPIAAPSNDGKNLEGVYSYYDGYISGLLQLWLPLDGHTARPMVAFGGPVRDWIKRRFGVDLKVLSLTNLQLESGIRVATLATNHPSFIYNAVDRLQSGNTPTNEQMAMLMRIMQQDLIASNWQAMMGANPKADPKATLDACTQTWSNSTKQARICQLTYIQVFNKSPEEAAKSCAQLPKPVNALLEGLKPIDAQAFNERLEALQAEIGALDSREPQDIKH